MELNYSSFLNWFDTNTYIFSAFINVNIVFLLKLFGKVLKSGFPNRVYSLMSLYVTYQIILINLDRFYDFKLFYFLIGLGVVLLLALIFPKSKKPFMVKNKRFFDAYLNMYNITGLISIGVLPIILQLDSFEGVGLAKHAFFIAWTLVGAIVSFYPLMLFKHLPIRQNQKSLLSFVTCMTFGVATFFIWPFIFFKDFKEVK